MTFQSRTAKRFCCLACYVASSEFSERNSKAYKTRCENNIKRSTSICIECKKEFYAKPSTNRKYCSKNCYRKYLAKRFDRFIANPETIALPQNYDEFLSGGLLNCLIEGCSWKGHHLSTHINQAHGIPAEKFKELAGFNKTTGVVSAPLREELCAREHIHHNMLKGFPEGAIRNTNRRTYSSREGAEHKQKARAISIEDGECPKRKCRGCDKWFHQSTPFGHAVYCGVKCRDEHYIKQKQEISYSLICDVCGAPFTGTYQQGLRVSKGLIVVCSFTCRQRRAGRIARGTWVEIQPKNSRNLDAH